MPVPSTPSITPALARHGQRRRRTRIAIWGIILTALTLIAAHLLLPKQDHYYPDIVLEAAENLQISFIHKGQSSAAQCETTTRAITQAMLGFCPDCTIVHARCQQELSPRQQLLLSGQAVDVPVIRIPKGMLIFDATTPGVAEQTCRDSERHSGGAIQCKLPSTAALATALATSSHNPMGFDPSHSVLGGLTLLAALTSFLICGLIILSERWHGRYSHDAVNSGPQKFHAIAVPRIGGLGIACAIGTIILGLDSAGLLSTSTAGGYALLALAAVPAFAGGLAEDLTKKVGVLARLLLTMTSGVLASLLIGATLNRLDVPGLDALLQHWPLFAIAFTAFAVGGVANAINIIDGYHGLVGGYSIIVLAALAWVSAQVGDQVVLVASLTMLGAMAGFLVWNWPKGRIFLGDGGAYLLGFWLAELGVLLVVRNPQVSPWFPLVLMAYPIWETLFSMYRRKILRGHSAGHPDALHLHQLIYQRLARIAVGSQIPADQTRRNSGVAPYVWLGAALFTAPAITLWHSTPWLLGLASLFVVSYVWLYLRLACWHTPAWMIRRNTSLNH